MAKSIGIPRALYYFEYFPFWKTFFENLGFNVIVSEETNRRILDDGIEYCSDEACLPIKVAFGHVLNLRNKVDYIFLPKLMSMSKGEYNCPMFGGIVDMINNSISSLPKLVNVEINLRNKHNTKFLYEIAKELEVPRRKVIPSYLKAIDEYVKIRLIMKQGITPKYLGSNQQHLKESDKDSINILLMGHAYNIYDSFINMNILKKLRTYDYVNVILMDSKDSYEITKKCSFIEKKMFWKFGRQASNITEECINEGEVDGVIYLSSFGCGVDSFVADICQREYSNEDIPFIMLNFDEHSGEAGLVTRIEAFIDMIGRRSEIESDFPSYG